MKRQRDGWHNGQFHYLGRIARHDRTNDPDFDSKVHLVAKALQGKLRPGSLKTDGKPKSDSRLNMWLCDVANFIYSGSWQGQDISEGHLNEIAQKLGWPEVWGKGGNVQYCVDARDIYRLENRIYRGQRSEHVIGKL
jgi:hypothetical protein